MPDWTDPSLPAKKRAEGLLSAAGGRGSIKRLASAIADDASLRLAVLEAGRRRGADLPDDAVDWPAKKLLRRALARDGAAQVRKNPIARDEDFTCAVCGYAVKAHGRTARDHCPRCLCSLHVDVVPGDRAAACQGVLRPQRVWQDAGAWRIGYRCERCHAEKVNRAILDGDDPDDWDLLCRVAGQV